jgi:aspartate aminotransferase-like enzyme
MWMRYGSAVRTRTHAAREITPVSKRRKAYLIYNETCSANHSMARSRWDIYTVVNGQRDYHYRGHTLAVVVAFAVRNGLKIVDEEGALSRVWEVEDEATND